MTYLQFHLVFTLPWLAILTWSALRAHRAGQSISRQGITNRFAVRVLIAHLVMAFVYTTPWDNYLVFREVWGYPPGRVLFTIFYVPIEEYAFFLIQAAGTALFLYFLLRARPWRRSDHELPSLTLRWVGAGLLLMLAVLGAVGLRYESTTYLGLITAWALPVVALQWGFGGDFLIRRWRLVLTAIGIPTLWLWFADRIAIGLEIWWISPQLTTGLKPLGLPIEEALFFLVTNVLVVFGITMAMDEDAWERVTSMWRHRFEIWRVGLLFWSISMVPAPLMPDAFLPLAYVSTGLLTISILGYAVQRHGARAWLAFLVAFVFGVLIEAVGVRTGVPFGAYDYMDGGLQVLGVPLLVPLGWWAFTLVSIVIAPVRLRWLLAPLALVAWDVGLDPLMVQQGVWTFSNGAYFGVPLSNFLGWFLSGLVLMTLLQAILPNLRDDVSPTLRLVYLGQAAFLGLGLVLFGLPGAGLGAAAAMLGFVLLAHRGSLGLQGR